MELLVNRDEELNILEEEYRREGFRLIVLYGRRRMGKTFLLRFFTRNKKKLYYLAAELPYNALSEEFSRAVKEQLGLPISGDVVEVLSAVASLVKERIVVVLDEFQYMVEADPSLLSRLQRLIDEKLSATNMVIILCGSAVSFFERELLAYRAPLFGRRTSEIRLKPMRIWEAWGFNPSLSLTDVVIVYSIVGGTPAYLASLREVTPAGAVEEILKPGTKLHDEAVELLRQEVREPRTYMAILRAVAEGRDEPSQAAQASRVDPRSISKYVELLEELDILERVRPLGFKKPVKLRFKDNYFRFWFTYVHPARSLIEAGAWKDVRNAVLSTLNSYVSRAFEETILPQIAAKLVEQEIIRFKPLEAGPWWHRGIEIDYVMRSPGKASAFIEAKWAELDSEEAERELKRLEEKARVTGLSSPVNIFVLIAKKLEEPIIEEHYVAVDMDYIQRKGIIKPAPRRSF